MKLHLPVLPVLASVVTLGSRPAAAAEAPSLRGAGDFQFGVEMNVTATRHLESTGDDFDWYKIKFASKMDECMKDDAQWDGSSLVSGGSGTHTHDACDDSDRPLWRYDHDTNQIKHKRGGCLLWSADLNGGDERLESGACNNNHDNQKWFLDGANRLRSEDSRISDKCAYVDGSEKVRMGSCNGNVNRKIVLDEEFMPTGVKRSIRFDSDETKCMRTTAKYENGVLTYGDKNVYTNDCSGYSGEKWSYDEDKFAIKSDHGGCLEVDPADSSSMPNVHIAKCDENIRQKWYRDTFGRIRNRAWSSDHLCLSRQGSNNNVRMEECRFENNRDVLVSDSFFEKNPMKWFHIRFHSDYHACMRADGINTTTHTGSCSSYTGSKWKWDPDTLEIKNKKGGCLHVDGSSGSDPDVSAKDCLGVSNQKWYLDGSNRLRSKEPAHSSKCLKRVESSGNVCMDDCGGSSNRKIVVDNAFFDHCDDLDAVARRLAPIWHFKGNTESWPMDAEVFYQRIVKRKSDDEAEGSDRQDFEDGGRYVETTSFDRMFAGEVPVYYTIDEKCGPLDENAGLIFIRYLTFFGFQHSCQDCNGDGAHQGGFEEVTVVVDHKHCASAVGTLYKQHKGFYVRRTSGRPEAYVGRWAHGTYDNKQCSYAFPDSRYWNDPRCDDVSWDPVATNSLYKLSFNPNPPAFGDRPQTWQATLFHHNDTIKSYVKSGNAKDDAEQLYDEEKVDPGIDLDNSELWGVDFFKRVIPVYRQTLPGNFKMVQCKCL